MVDISRDTANVVLPAPIASEIWGNTVEASAAMSLARQVSLPGVGTTYQTITGEPEAEWVGETESKPVSRHTLGSKAMTPYKLAVIEPFSDEFKRDLPGLYAELARRLPYSLAKKFDATIFTSTAPGSGFDVLSDAAAVAVKPGTGDKTTYKGLVAADTAVSAAGGQITGWALAPQARQYLLGAVDGQNRPFFLDSAASGGRGLTLLGAPTVAVKAVYKAGTPNQIGIAGDWSEAMFGVVSGIQLSVSNEAMLQDGTQTIEVGSETAEIPRYINLFQQNMFALRVEMTVGFLVRDKDKFVRLTDGTVA
jgi:HK97 family phage major capsid protein